MTKKTLMAWMVLLLGYKSVMMAIIIASLTIIANTFYVIFCFTKLNVKIDFHSPDKHVLKEISAFSGFIALSAIADQINWSVDKILLGRYWGPAVTAVYSVSSTIQSLYMQISTAISNVFIPRVNRMVSEGESNETLTALFIRIGRFQMLVLLPILLGFIFLGKRFISVWCPTGYDEAYPIAMMLMIPSTLPYLQNIGIAIQTAQNRHKFRSVLYILMATVNFALSIPLCKLYGGVGCAVGTAISLIIANGLVMNIYYHKIIRLNVVKYWSSMLSFMPTVIASTGLGLTMNYFLNIDSWLKLFVCIGMFCIVYILMVWFTAMNREEKKSVLSMMNRRER
ncbi:MAG: colanic acid exporter [Firmicutes bacterium ADurb.Bin419]|nr:MAG: colanic acid exporter [Firmicutes bacterium ADurb.Bin419]